VPTCPYCGREKDEATACPHCGCVPDETAFGRQPGEGEAERTQPRWWFEPQTSPSADREPARTELPRKSRRIELPFLDWLREEGPAGVPRQFGVVRVLGMLVVFALAFGLLRWLGAPTSVFVGVTLFFGLVGTGQAVLYRGRRPRVASVLAGLVAGPVVAVLMVLLELNFGAATGTDDFLDVTVMAFLFGLMGAPCGYLAGGLLAAIFLVRGPDLENAEPTSSDLSEDTPNDPFAD